MKAIMVLAVVIGSIAAVTAVFIVIALHGGFTANNMGALGLLITTITTLGATVINLVRTEQLTAKVTNGLIPQKTTEALQQPETQAAIQEAVKPVVAEAVQAVVQSSTAPDSPAAPTKP